MIAEMLLQILLRGEAQPPALDPIDAGRRQAGSGAAANLDKNHYRAVARNHIQFADTIADLARHDSQTMPLQQRTGGALGRIALPLPYAARWWHPFATCKSVIGSGIVNNAAGDTLGSSGWRRGAQRNG
jgi:hypothetical protein